MIPATLKGRDGRPVAEVEVPPPPGLPEGVVWGGRFFRRVAVDGLGDRLRPRATYAEGTLYVVPPGAEANGRAAGRPGTGGGETP